MVRVDVGVILLWEPGRQPEFEARVSAAERLGYSFIGIGDSPTLYREVTASLAWVSANTSRCGVGPTVSTPFGRHPVMVANALSTLHDLNDGRVVFGIGSGGSATEAMGRPRATITELRSFITALRSLLRGEGIEWEGTKIPPIREPRPVPIYLSAYGPATMRLAGEAADGVILAVGASEPLIEQFRQEVSRGAETAGRSPADIDIWVLARASVGEDRQAALDDVKPSLASAGCFGLRSSAQMESVPVRWRDALRELQRRYDPAAHLVSGGVNAQLVDELGLGDFLMERFAVVGTPHQCREQLDAMTRAGVSRLLILAVDGDPDTLIEDFAHAVGQV